MQISAPAAVTNDDIINEYLDTMQTEINSSPNYKRINLNTLTKLSQFHKNKSFKDMKREDILSFLRNLRKADEIDPLHKWIGTYNLYITNLVRFFKWLYNPTLEPRQRPRPKILNNIPILKRKEVSIYKPSDLWIHGNIARIDLLGDLVYSIFYKKQSMGKQNSYSWRPGKQ